MNVLELYSGIGGMHFALNASGINAEVKLAIDINTVANSVYSSNFPTTRLDNKNIQNIKPELLNKLNINMILMSPPCQPFTRNGKFGDTSDPRTASFLHILQILPDIKKLQYVLVENVKGFENSTTHTLLIDSLKKAGFTVQDYILSPTELGVPNSRTRYYCLATKLASDNLIKTKTILHNQFHKEVYQISQIIDTNVTTEDYLLKEKQLQKLSVLDVCFPESRRSCCFTKAYGQYLEGTGSIFTPKSEKEFKTIITALENIKPETDAYKETLKNFELRYFTPLEISKLMCFPKEFQFPEHITNKQKYRLLGNSINVQVVAELIKILTYSQVT